MPLPVKAQGSGSAMKELQVAAPAQIGSNPPC